MHMRTTPEVQIKNNLSILYGLKKNRILNNIQHFEPRRKNKVTVYISLVIILVVSEVLCYAVE